MFQSQHDQTNKMAQTQISQGQSLFHLHYETTQSIYSILITCMLLSDDHNMKIMYRFPSLKNYMHHYFLDLLSGGKMQLG